ncbi:hypothetical protein BATDEDRAFT_92005 [Batrachochytrium dendrobatidis JAM81]|uniref:Uncharacterized protein n=2 Tax=Batrachochytrium dendrobatidis TaxID=109871 RepID=F4PCF9_BATDJ|nr:uncharacterized protein BATDEDRAFT_92005 [Batrachochytrium dendrobatidis JAM81]EGF77191.1 hypothetical protein BATDEDRAFT_92005 [Batrachochytrium dendrobatidis JAM81]KAJ8330412.1 hypothetical protein O5D80_001406 [Batrachochytrium dendrobatidis]KAK5665399.1 hypothetical protein QVD99_007751 [Batrachochytrium dendrobatidis]OAJ44794.1 hypothetical protein BDEG_27987 [Batrachochytrium dendrobatidis JEL423]|eukprot:XP_006682305.1 hypothetical protein BATDEDRAFT_92005 [Batrachochytrium dendrobatidis JAM81]
MQLFSVTAAISQSAFSQNSAYTSQSSMSCASSLYESARSRAPSRFSASPAHELMRSKQRPFQSMESCKFSDDILASATYLRPSSQIMHKQPCGITAQRKTVSY